MKALLPLILIPLGFTACGPVAHTPRAQNSQHMAVVSAGLSFTDLKGPAPYYYRVGVKLRDGAPAPSFLKARFENPANPSKPFIVTSSVAKPGSAVTISTPTFRTPPSEKMNRVTVELYTDRALRNRADEVSQDFRVMVPSPEFLRKNGLGHLVD